MPRPSSLETTTFAEARVNGGMITSIDAADIPPNAFQRVKNARCRYDVTSRRPGHAHFDTKNPLPIHVQHILHIATLRDNHGTAYTFKFSPTRIERLTGVPPAHTWPDLAAGVGGSLTGGNTDRFKTVVINNRFVYSNNGANVIQEVDPIAGTYKALGNAPKYKYITGFANRVVAAYKADSTGSEGVELAWSGLNNIGEWNNAVDKSAGTTPLVESPSDFSDHIAGVFGLTNTLLVLRERSVWQATRNPVAANPFNLFNASPGVGCDSPYSAAPWEHGLIWFDRRSNTVWAYELGAKVPEPIGRPIDNQFPRNIDDPKTIFAAYRSIENEYSLCIPAVGTTLVRVFTFNFRTKSWVYDEIDNICSADNVDLSNGYVAIDDLIGTIDGLTGTMDGLGPASTTIPVSVYGKKTGHMLVEDNSSVDDGSGDDAGIPFTTELISKNFELDVEAEIIAEIRIEYIARAACTLNLFYAKNGTLPDLTGAPVKTVTQTTLGKTRKLIFKKQIRANQFCWGMTITGGRCDIMKYVVFTYKSSEARKEP